MKELDFDVFKGQDAGRTFYRGLFIYSGLYLLKNYLYNERWQRCVKYIENQLWKSSNSYIQMRQRLRLFYVSMITSFVPYMTRLLYERYYGSDDFKLFYTQNSMLGFINGSLISFLTLSSQPAFVLFGGSIGILHSIIFTYSFRKFIIQRHQGVKQENLYVDKEFKLI